MKKIRVMIVDDSALVRQVLTRMLNDDARIEVVGAAADPYLARDKIKKLNPDVLTLDVEMPRMDGLTFLSNLMRLRPMPVVMVSSLTEKGAEITFQALELGAIDFVSKPKFDIAQGLSRYQEDLIEKIMTAAKARVSAIARRVEISVQPKLNADAIIKKKSRRKHFKTTDKIIALGASTGGTEAIKEILMAMPPGSPGIVITQHIPETFSGPFARRMDQCSALKVTEAEDGAQIVQGHAYIAPGNMHLMVERDGARYVCRLNDGPEVNRHRPSVDVMFRSMAQNVGPNAIGVLLTGMGADGAQGLKEIHETGAYTLAQDERTSVVWGMPGEAVKLGAVTKVASIGRVADILMDNA